MAAASREIGAGRDAVRLLAIDAAVSASQLDAVRTLFRAFVAWHLERHPQDRAQIAEYFDAAAFEAELASLPGGYTPPDGCLLLATLGGEAVGCVAMRRMDDPRDCEMKRMFVLPRFHRQGVGRALAERLLTEARAAGFRTMRLNTSIRQPEARSLYERLGFRSTGPYGAPSEALRRWLVFMALAL